MTILFEAVTLKLRIGSAILENRNPVTVSDVYRPCGVKFTHPSRHVALGSPFACCMYVHDTMSLLLIGLARTAYLSWPLSQQAKLWYQA